MKRMMTVAAACVMLLGAGMASASVGPVRASSEQPSADAQDAMFKLRQAFADIGKGNYDKAAPELDSLVASLGFNQLDPELRFHTLNVAAAIAFQQGRYAKAHGFAIRATGFNQAEAGAWSTRLASAMYIGDYPDAGRCVQAIARHWPDELANMRPQAALQLHHALRLAHEGDIDSDMLEALFDANWPSEEGTYDSLWRDLALIHIEHDQTERAATIAGRIRSSQTALSMRVDKRFDPVTRQRPEAFDVERLLDAQIASARAGVKDHPDRLEAVERLQDLLIDKGRNAEVLAISDAAVAHAEAGDGEKAYTDFAATYNWVLDQRSRALEHAGRWDEAVREMARAARRPEGGGVNVSQSINLAGLYTDMDEPDKADAAIVEPGEMSPYGRMQMEEVRLQIAIEKNDAAAIATHMDYLREHRTDDIATWQRALLRHGDLDAAAALLVERLNAPDWRNAALVEMQHYAARPQTPVMQRLGQRRDAVMSRPEVQAALAKVGRVERFDIAAPAY